MNDPIILKLPPPPPSEVEPKILGAIMDLTDQLTLFEGSGLNPDDFSDRRVSLCWNIGRRIAERRGQVNALTVFSAGKRARVLDDGAFNWLQQLQATNALTRESFLQVAEDLRMGVRGRSNALKLEEIARQMRFGRYKPAHIAAELEAMQFSLSGENLQDETADSDIIDLLATWDERERVGKPALIPTGIKVLDDLIGGWDFTLNVVVGQPGTGKNALIGGIAKTQLMADPEIHVGLFGLEDGSEWFTKRWVAQAMGIPVRQVGSRQRTPAELDLLENTIAPGLHPVLKRLHVYRRDEIKVEDWLHVATHWVRNRKVRLIYLDNLGQMDHTLPGWKQQDNRIGVAKAVKVFARFARRHGVPVVLLAHSNRSADDGERPPKMSEIQDSAFVERRARKIIGVWTKTKQMRVTILKDQEGDGAGTTLELDRFITAALVDPDGGKVVDLRQEAREDRAEKDADRDARLVAAAERRAAIRASKKPKEDPKEEPKKEEPQMTLLDGKDPKDEAK